jgi:hypothetical protein
MEIEDMNQQLHMMNIKLKIAVHRYSLLLYKKQRELDYKLLRMKNEKIILDKLVGSMETHNKLATSKRVLTTVGSKMYKLKQQSEYFKTVLDKLVVLNDKLQSFNNNKNLKVKYIEKHIVNKQLVNDDRWYKDKVTSIDAVLVKYQYFHNLKLLATRFTNSTIKQKKYDDLQYQFGVCLSLIGGIVERLDIIKSANSAVEKNRNLLGNKEKLINRKQQLDSWFTHLQDQLAVSECECCSGLGIRARAH